MVLIIIAPLMSALYAFGRTTKENFNKWIRELTMGIMVQPFHMLIYSILIILPIRVMKSSGVSVTVSGVEIFNYATLDAKIYFLLSMSMIRPCERYLRKLFGFGTTVLDNQASFESGKRTIDAGKKVAKQVVDTTVKVGLAVATGGIGLAAGGVGLAAGAAGAAGAGAAGAAGAAGGAAGAAGAAGGAAGAAGGAAGAAGGMGGALGEGLGGLGEGLGGIGDGLGGLGDGLGNGLNGIGEGLNGLGDGLGGDMLGTGENFDPFYGDQPLWSSDGFIEGQQMPLDDNVLNQANSFMEEDDLGNLLNDFQEAGYDSFDMADTENDLRLSGHGKTFNEEELNGYLDRMQNDLGLDDDGRNELEDRMRSLGHGDNDEPAIGENPTGYIPPTDGDALPENSKMNEQELQQYLDDMGLDDDERALQEQRLRSLGHGGEQPEEEARRLNGETGNDQKQLDGEKEFKIDNATIEINSADEMGVQQVNTLNADAIDSLEGDIDQLDGDAEIDGLGGSGQPDLLGSDLRQVLGGGPLATALGSTYDKYKQAKDSIQNNPVYNALTSTDARNAIQDTRAAMHEFVDTLYMPNDAPGDWRASIELKKTDIKKVEERRFNNFVNNKENQQRIIQAKGLQDTLNSRGQVVKSKEEKAKDALKGMEPYVKAGLNNPIQIMQLQAAGGSPKDAMKTVLKTEIQSKAGEVRYNNFVNNTENVQQMSNIVADRMNIPQDRRNDINIQQTINQQVQQQFEESRKYIESGAAKDSQTAVRLSELERKIDQKVNMVGSAGTTKERYVERADTYVEKIVQKAVEQKGGAQLNKKEIQEFLRKNPVQLPGSSSNSAVKELQGVLQKELESRLNGLSVSSSSSSSSTRVSGGRAPAQQVINNNTTNVTNNNVSNNTTNNNVSNNTSNTNVSNNTTRINNTSNTTNVNNTSNTRVNVDGRSGSRRVPGLNNPSDGGSTTSRRTRRTGGTGPTPGLGSGDDSTNN